MSADPYKYFRIEAAELVEGLGKGVLELEKTGSTDTVARLLRLAHTLKGAARVVRQPQIADHAHAIEDVLAAFRDLDQVVPADAISRLLGLVDMIAAGVAALAEKPAPAVAAPQPSSQPAEDLTRAARADMRELDELLEAALEANARLGAVSAATGGLETARGLADALADRVHDRELRVLAEQLRDALAGAERAVRTGLEQTARELDHVCSTAEQLRLVPVGSLFTSLERTARDVAQALDKKVTFVAHGADVRLDATVLATVQGALVQLVRNAVAHGAESPADRRAAGKSDEARVELAVVRRGRSVSFACRDDGRGIDVAGVRRVALERGLVAPDAPLDEQVLARILLDGRISTSPQVTRVAGRGVGLDVVREAAERLGGQIRLRTTAGGGTTFELVVPASLASIEAIAIEVGGVIAQLPLDAVRSTRRVTDAAIARTARGEAIEVDGSLIPLIGLGTVLRRPPSERTAWAGVIVEAGGERAVVTGDRIAGMSSIVVRPVPDIADVEPVVAGAVLDADGAAHVVLDPEQLITAALRQGPAHPRTVAQRLPVLVIDDSLTTRMLEQSILESAGYDVDTAISGEQALGLVRGKRYALILCDVEMPGIDGFTVIERIRADPALRDIPAILVTSRASPEDLARGEAVGAQGYIVKNQFDQTDLLARIARLTGARS